MRARLRARAPATGTSPGGILTRLGALAGEMRSLTIPVIDRLDRLTATPDIIHGNAPIETVAALLQFPEVPAVFACHAWDNPDALPPNAGSSAISRSTIPASITSCVRRASPKSACWCVSTPSIWSVFRGGPRFPNVRPAR